MIEKTQLREIRIELQHCLLDLELLEGAVGKRVSVPDPTLCKLENLVRDLRIFQRSP